MSSAGEYLGSGLWPATRLNPCRGAWKIKLRNYIEFYYTEITVRIPALALTSITGVAI